MLHPAHHATLSQHCTAHEISGVELCESVTLEISCAVQCCEISGVELCESVTLDRSASIAAAPRCGSRYCVMLSHHPTQELHLTALHGTRDESAVSGGRFEHHEKSCMCAIRFSCIAPQQNADAVFISPLATAFTAATALLTVCSCDCFVGWGSFAFCGGP